MGGRPSAPDNSAQIAAAKAQQDQLAKQNRDMQLKKEAIASRATADFNSRRRGLSGRKTLIATSESGTNTLGSTDKLN